MKLFNKTGIVVAIIFGIILLFVSAKENTSYEINPEIVAKNILNKSDQVNPRDLNEWIIEKNQDYMLIDIRTDKEFEMGHIPSAENIPLSELMKKETISELPKRRPVIIYSNGNSHAYQCWIILKSAGINAFVLEGGYNYWGTFPTLPKNGISDDEVLIYKKDLAAANSLKGIQPSNNTGNNSFPSKKKVFKKKKKKKKKNKLEGC